MSTNNCLNDIVSRRPDLGSRAAAESEPHCKSLHALNDWRVWNGVGDHYDTWLCVYRAAAAPGLCRQSFYMLMYESRGLDSLDASCAALLARINLRFGIL